MSSSSTSSSSSSVCYDIYCSQVGVDPIVVDSSIDIDPNKDNNNNVELI
jgi:hypothetical protein